MKLVKEEREIRKIIEDLQDGSISTEHVLQRKSGQFTVEQKSLLIDSILRGYPIPPIYVFKENGKEYVLDGKQRLTTILEFNDKDFKLVGDFKAITQTAEDGTVETFESEQIKGKLFNELDGLVKYFRSAKLDFHIFSDCTDEEVNDIFYRLNNGVTLNTSQKIKCFTDTETKEAIRKILSMPLFSDVVSFTSKQRNASEDEITVLQILMLNKYEASAKTKKNEEAQETADGKKKKERHVLDFRKDSIIDFAKKNPYKKENFDAIEKAVDELGDFFKNMNAGEDESETVKMKNFKKVSVSTAIAAYMAVKDKDKEKYKMALHKLFDNYDNYPEYKELVKGGTATGTNVKARYDFFKSLVNNAK